MGLRCCFFFFCGGGGGMNTSQHQEHNYSKFCFKPFWKIFCHCRVMSTFLTFGVVIFMWCQYFDRVKAYYQNAVGGLRPLFWSDGWFIRPLSVPSISHGGLMVTFLSYFSLLWHLVIFSFTFQTSGSSSGRCLQGRQCRRSREMPGHKQALVCGNWPAPCVWRGRIPNGTGNWKIDKKKLMLWPNDFKIHVPWNLFLVRLDSLPFSSEIVGLDACEDSLSLFLSLSLSLPLSLSLSLSLTHTHTFSL